MAVGQLEIREETSGGRRTLALAGELDIATAGPLEEAVQRACGGDAHEVLLDLRELSFIDSTGFRAILTAKARCEEAGRAFYLTRGQEPVQRLFEVSGVLKKLPFLGGGSR
jgi:anti-anti-sigma factor